MFSFLFCNIWKKFSRPVLHVTEPTTCFRSSDSREKRAILAASLVRSLVLSSRSGGFGLKRSPSGQTLLLEGDVCWYFFEGEFEGATYSTADRTASTLSIASSEPASWTIFLLVAWLTQGAPSNRLISPRLNH